jgi:hypothetical protein
MPGDEKSVDSWARLRFLVGAWRGTSEGEPGAGTGERTYAFILRDRFLEARNRVVYPPQDKNPKGEIHEDRSLFSVDRARKMVVLREFHVEGFVNQYIEQAGGGEDLLFTTEAIENIPRGWRARVRIARRGPDGFTETFELAPPDEDFHTYSRSEWRRVPNP